jgi:signal transduction histidine kinase
MALEQVFSNLINNALNYLDPQRAGIIEIDTQPAPAGGVGEGFTTIVVKDNGLGIPPAQQQKIFQAFQRAHPEVAKGEGIGLAIAARVVERHRGRVWVKSQVGAGSTFCVGLPIFGADMR